MVGIPCTLTSCHGKVEVIASNQEVLQVRRISYTQDQKRSAKEMEKLILADYTS